ncbi:hypothetical protein E2562_008825 [Oryza meyeriana var. granulata]|uniref:Uncharacterized protein n=1 Tax=Oryza meyeriana var. granulata TaxID=110450 RepID=A0A6G1D049_9ORYZ|nr:hypothetical protein E2562_008825 [Oryza meyeriana var. granulata]
MGMRLLMRNEHLTVSPFCYGHGDSRPDDWVLLDVRAYIADRQNATTATTELSNSHQIQVTI